MRWLHNSYIWPFGSKLHMCQKVLEITRCGILGSLDLCFVCNSGLFSDTRVQFPWEIVNPCRLGLRLTGWQCPWEIVNWCSPFSRSSLVKELYKEESATKAAWVHNFPGKLLTGVSQVWLTCIAQNKHVGGWWWVALLFIFFRNEHFQSAARWARGPRT